MQPQRDHPFQIVEIPVASEFRKIFSHSYGCNQQVDKLPCHSFRLAEFVGPILSAWKRPSGVPPVFTSALPDHCLPGYRRRSPRFSPRRRQKSQPRTSPSLGAYEQKCVSPDSLPASENSKADALSLAPLQGSGSITLVPPFGAGRASNRASPYFASGETVGSCSAMRSVTQSAA